jgi:hypothetical protein
MGYYTNFTLRAFHPTKNGIGTEFCLGPDILDKEKYEFVGYAICDDGSNCDAVKWYDYDKDMREFSKYYPNLIFELSGEGEESGDLWKAYYQNGSAQYCRGKVVFPPFDPNQLSTKSSMPSR